MNEDLQSVEAIYRHNSCAHDSEIYTDYFHIKLRTPKTHLLGSFGEFCAAFYHVPSMCGTPQYCLDPDNCKFSQGVLPISIVALVKFEIKDGDDIIVRYSDHCGVDGARKCAADFFLDDTRQPQNEALESSISQGRVKKITIYITSVSRCWLDVLLTLFVCRGWRFNIHVCTLFVRRGWRFNICMKPAHEGVMIGNLTSILEHVKIEGMKEEDWNFLLNFVEMNDGQRRIIPPYSESRRKDRDEAISKSFPFGYSCQS